LRDVTARKHAEEALRSAKASLEKTNQELERVLLREQQLARTDGLTGLYNYRYFFELATREFNIAMRYRRPLSILMFDTDDFKKVNDTLGHSAGDKILALVAQATAAQMRSVDILARYGGDEFIILLSQTSAKQAYPIAERIRNSVAGMKMPSEKGPISVTLSIGIAEIQYEPAEESVEHIVQRADKALYAVKQAGRNRAMIYDPSVNGAA
jgi:diguanylate cyclase (GGDEF)-like protein